MGDTTSPLILSMAQIGYASLILALACAVYSIITSLISLRTGANLQGKGARHALYAVTGLLTLAMLALLFLLLQQDFQTHYVASYTDSTLPTVYVISALWAGQEGSLLLWAWMLSLCSVVFLLQYREKASEEVPYLQLSLAVILGFFLILLLLMANPFKQLVFIPPDGNGLNPLLQNLYMAIHPPVLFIGYAGFVVPFTLAFAALCTGTIDERRLHIHV